MLSVRMSRLFICSNDVGQKQHRVSVSIGILYLETKASWRCCRPEHEKEARRPKCSAIYFQLENSKLLKFFTSRREIISMYHAYNNKISSLHHNNDFRALSWACCITYVIFFSYSFLSHRYGKFMLQMSADLLFVFLLTCDTYLIKGIYTKFSLLRPTKCLLLMFIAGMFTIFFLIIGRQYSFL